MEKSGIVLKAIDDYCQVLRAKESLARKEKELENTLTKMSESDMYVYGVATMEIDQNTQERDMARELLAN